MIATLNGMITDKSIDSLVIEVSGVGYEIFATGSDLDNLSNNDLVKMYIYEHIREQSHDLFGFISSLDKQLFEKLLSVNGVGPKMALAIMNVGTSEAVKQAIAKGDVKLLQSASGVGKKVAERIVVDLKDKVGLIATEQATAFLSESSNEFNSEAIDALLSLGYSQNDANLMLKEIDPDLSTEEKIKLALKVKK